jgi:hypothetical protein
MTNPRQDIRRTLVLSLGLALRLLLARQQHGPHLAQQRLHCPGMLALQLRQPPLVFHVLQLHAGFRLLKLLLLLGQPCLQLRCLQGMVTDATNRLGAARCTAQHC